MVIETDDLVNDLLNILQPTQTVVPVKKEVVVPKKEKIAVAVQPIKKEEAVKVEPKSKIRTEISDGFLDGIIEQENPSPKASVLISEDIYEIFVSIKRAKKIKNVPILLDHALKYFIKHHVQEIKTLLYDSQNNEIL